VGSKEFYENWREKSRWLLDLPPFTFWGRRCSRVFRLMKSWAWLMVLSGFIDGGESKNLLFEGRKWVSGMQVRY
jgi:hypothetical protein